MNEIKEEYNTKLKELEEVKKNIEELKNDDKVKSYNYLTFKKGILSSEVKDLYKKMKTDEYSKCQHLLITTLKEKTKNNDVIRYTGCLKCGLSEKILYHDSWLLDYDKLSLDEQTMYDFASKNYYSKTNISNDIVCDLDLAMAIYNRIKKTHPKINDKLAIKYLEIALDNIRNIPTTEERKQSRIRRLGLKPEFNNWD